MLTTLAHSLPPGMLLIVGAILVPALPGMLRGAWMLALPLVGLGQVLLLDNGTYLTFSAFDLQLAALHVDRLARLFGIIFHIAAIISVIYTLHERDPVQQVSGLIYAGAAIAAVFAGDLLTLFVFWEMTAIASVFLILARRTPEATRAAMRYLLIQISSGVILLAGVIVLAHEGRGIAFGTFDINDFAGALILVAFGIKAAFPLLHNWLQDAYPQATVGGTVFLSSFTTKLAIYALARGYAGTEQLIWIGTLMTAFPIFYAVIENDLRRVLAYSLNNQLGFMVCGIGIGTEMAINGAAAHAFSHILYKALLFMSMGAVLHRVGTVLGSELGGLYKSMPWTTGFCIVGAASISAFPLFSGFISKALIIEQAAEQGYVVVWLVLLFASAGVFHHSGIKIPYFAFFAHDSGKRCKEAPLNMLIAMAIAAAFCIGIGVFPGVLYDLLPYPVDFEPYTVGHVVGQLQLLLFSALAFAVLMRTGIYPPELRSTNLDFDWVYRRLLPRLAGAAYRGIATASAAARDWALGLTRALYDYIVSHHGPEGVLARTWPTGSMVMWAVVLLTACLVFFYAR
ncbi:MAG: Na(+)/H(+) antiporter subunit D [Alphaproteobacteria bacterium]